MAEIRIQNYSIAPRHYAYGVRQPYQLQAENRAYQENDQKGILQVAEFDIILDLEPSDPPEKQTVSNVQRCAQWTYPAAEESTKKQGQNDHD